VRTQAHACSVHHKVMFMPLPTALLYVFQESGISALAKNANAKSETGVDEAGAVPEAATAAAPSPSPLSPAPSLAPLSGPSSHAAPPFNVCTEQPCKEVPDEDKVLCTDNLRILHELAATFYSQWRPEAILGDHFGELRFTRTVAGMQVKAPAGEEGRMRLLPLAAAAVMNLPWGDRVRALQRLGDSHSMLRDIILSINKLGYAPLLEWLQHVTLGTGSIEDEADADAAACGEKGKDGEVVLSTIHACKGAACPC
jgi:hypothetical protein